MHKVLKTFTTINRRFLPGTDVTQADCESPEHFARLVELGHIAKAPTADPVPAPAAHEDTA